MRLSRMDALVTHGYACAHHARTGSTDSYLRNFKWNTVKYRTDRSIKDIADALLQEVLAIEALVKTKLAANSQVKASLAAIQRKQT